MIEQNNVEMNHWKKNINQNFISGEDLLSGLDGLKPEMIVTFSREKNEEAYDQQKNLKTVVTGFYMKNILGVELKRPIVMNKRNGRVLEKIFGTANMNLWEKDKHFILYCAPDKRHGHVVMIKPYEKIEMVFGDTNFTNCRNAYLADHKNLDLIKSKYNVSDEVEAELVKGKEVANEN